MLKPWVTVLTSFHNIPIFGRIWMIVASLGIYSGIVLLVDSYYLHHVKTISSELHGVLGLILGLLLVFRTNTSYDRWWEGRKLWGQLVNDSRNLAIKVQTCVRAASAEKHQLGRWLIDFALALKGHLRGGLPLQKLPGFEDATEQPKHVPAYVAGRIYDQLERWRQANQLGGFELWFLDQHAGALMNVCGACERIQKTPISISYRWFIRQSIGIYLITLPWGLLDTFGNWTIPAMVLLSYFMIGVELIAEEIEDPFGQDADDLMLDDICLAIEKSVREIMDMVPAQPATAPTTALDSFDFPVPTTTNPEP
ncbi:MAG: bestrophin family ion channel [Pirellulaceae bacterium]|nr:bestrophin family ion channel [Pirellulaceae bacterium]